MNRYVHFERSLWVQHADWVGLNAANVKEVNQVRKRRWASPFVG